MILDTTFIIDFLKGNKQAVDKLRSLKSSSEAILTTTVTVFELWQGLAFLKSAAEKEKILRILYSIGLLMLDFEGAKRAGEIKAKLRLAGESIDPEDCMIAGIALNHNEKILTRNVAHFSRIDELKVESY